MANVTRLDDRRRPASAPCSRVAVADWLRAADAEIWRISISPNELLPRLLDAGCVVTFSGPRGDTMARVTMPDGSRVEGTGTSAVDALVDVYATGAYLADLPAVLAAAAAHSEGAS